MSDETAGLGLFEYQMFAPALGLPLEWPGPAEARALVPRWVSAPLLGTEHATARLRRWVEGGGLTREDSPEARRRLIQDITVAAEYVLAWHIHAAFERLPTCVLQHLADNAVITAVGVDVAGCCMARRHRVTQTEETQTLTVEFKPPRFPSAEASAAEFEGYVAHEVAHAWTLPPVPLEPVTAEEQRKANDRYSEFLALAHGWNRLDMAAEPREDAELAAGALCRSWGFSGRSADGIGCARGIRAEVEEQAKRAHAELWPKLKSEGAA